MKIIVSFSGRFQPFHRGHARIYSQLTEKFPSFPVYILSADKSTSIEDPFTWDEKQKLAELAGIPPEKFIKVANVYSGTEIKETLNVSDDTVIIMAVSEKDKNRLITGEMDKNGTILKKNGEPSAIQPMPSDLSTLTPSHSYAIVLPTVEFDILGKKVTSASEIRDRYRNIDEKGREQILIELYGKSSPSLQKLFNKRLVKPLTESILLEFKKFIYGGFPQ